MPKKQTTALDNSIVTRLKAIQKKLGVKDDGILGPTTLSRIEALVDAAVQPPKKPDAVTFSLEVSRRGLEQIVQFEISSDSYYEKKLAQPIWPGGESGVTIGVGYDLGFNNKTTIRNDWGGKISDAHLERLLETSGKKGESARILIANLRDIKIPLAKAKEVYFQSTLPRYAKDTRDAYPGIELLLADAQAGLLSLVFNRGSLMDGARRREMKDIKPLVVSGDLKGIAEQIRLMKRLWDINQLPGLHVRRDAEAKMIQNARASYPDGEIVRI